MTDPRVEKLAAVLIDYSIEVREGDRVLVQGSTVSEPLLKAVYAGILKAGGHPLLLVGIPGNSETFFRYASDIQLEYVPEPIRLAMETYEAAVTIMGSDNTKSLSSVDPAKMVKASRAQTDIMQTMMKRLGAGDFRWVGTQFPTNANAQDAEMSLREYEDMVYNACLPDPDDPVDYWRRFSQWQGKIVDWLKGGDKVRVVGPQTDLTLSIAGRTFMNCDGRLNMPDGEVCTSPVEDSAEGHVLFSYPTIYQGREVTGVRLWFEKGRVVRAEAEKGGEFLNSTIDSDEGARFLGEFAIGTNRGIQRFTRSILFDEKINGSFHLALGMGLPETGGINQSAVHWDMVCDLRSGGEIWVDDELIYRNGEFTREF